ncbi:MAG: hypothetical protein HY225_01930 [Candidatus Vogelbacteria bacterium]|nr:hypothetical protein [Candidatus Vogelbacteria bacterium]
MSRESFPQPISKTPEIKSEYASEVTHKYFETGWDDLILEGNEGIKEWFKRLISL